MSKLRGIRIKDISDNYLTINRVIVDVDGKPTVKESGKAKGRLRKHRIPSYIGALISETSVRKSPDDYLISMCGHAIYMRWKRLLEKNDLNHMRFHDLRHLNASVMALLRIPNKYAQERGGWSSHKVMKRTYTHTFSEERTQVDDTIDNYFESRLGIDDCKKDPLPEEVIEILKKMNPDECMMLY